MSIHVPYANHVGHDPLEVAKPLLVLGWSDTAAISARVALEQCLREVVEAAGQTQKYPLGIAAIAGAIAKHELLPRKMTGRARSLGTKLNRVAHGCPIQLYKAAELVEAVAEHVGDIRRLK